MNKDEIMRMEAGREMDALVAEKVMKLKITNEHFGGYYFYVPLENGNLYEWHQLPFYSKNITAAWEVSEKLKANGLQMDFSNSTEPDGLYFCIFSNVDMMDYYSNAKTAPLAICRAALLAVMEA